jgi:hypothetical protein
MTNIGALQMLDGLPVIPIYCMGLYLMAATSLMFEGMSHIPSVHLDSGKSVINIKSLIFYTAAHCD